MSGANRLWTVDVFRGLCIVVMILVNSPGDQDVGYTQLRHVPWAGWTLADVVAPAFLWIVGFLIPATLKRAAAKGMPPNAITRRILSRVALLIIAGFAISILSALDFVLHGATLRDIGLLDILQRIALCYGLVAGIYVYFGTRGAVWLAFAALCAYGLALLGSIAVHGAVAAFARPTNFGAAIDHQLLGSQLNAGQSLITVPTSVVTTVCGLVCGRYVLAQRRPIRLLFLAGGSALVLGLLLAPVLPINRYLWTPSFVLVTSGVSAMFFCVLQLAEGRPGIEKLCAPLIDFGRNPLLMYALAAIIAGWLATIGFAFHQGDRQTVWVHLYRAMQAAGLPLEAASHAVTVVLLVMLWLLAHALNRRRLYLRL